MLSSGHKSRGFMMIAGLLVAFTIALGIFLSNLGAIQVGNYTRVFSTQLSMGRIGDALVRYAVVRQRLPCPANPALDASDAAAGYANADATDSAVPTTCAFPAGVVPWRSLGLSPSDVLDPWGRLISYRVYDGTIGLTQAEGASRVNCDTDNAGVVEETVPVNGLCSSDTNTLTDSFIQHSVYGGVTKGLVVTDLGTTVPQIAYALISHGPSGLGGYLQSGARMSMPNAAAADYPNTQSVGANYVKTSFSDKTVSAGTAGHFDDVVVYKKIGDFIALAKLDARNWPEVMPEFTVATTSNMTSPSTDPKNPHFESTGSAAAQTAFTAQQQSFGGAPAETVVYQGAGLAASSFASCLWWPEKLTIYDSLTPRAARIYMEFAAADNIGDVFAGFTLGFVAGNDALGRPTNSTCGTGDFLRSATGNLGEFTINVPDPVGIEAGLNVTGTGIGTSVGGATALVQSVVGTTVTLDQANTAAISGAVTFANARLIRRDLGWAGGTLAAYANRFAVEFDTSLDTVTIATPSVPTASDPTRPHLAVDYGGVTHGTNAESCASRIYGGVCDQPIGTFPLVVTTADQLVGASTISVASTAGIVHGMAVTGTGIGAGARVTEIAGTTISLGTGGATSTPVTNTSTETTNPVTFSAISSGNFMQNRLSVFHSIRADLAAKSCVSKASTTGSAGVSTITVPDTSQIALGMRVYGQNTAYGTTVTGIAGTTLTLSSANVGAVSERVDFGVPLTTIKTATGALNDFIVSVSDNVGVAVGMSVTGAGVGASAKVTNVSGTTVTLSVMNSSAIAGALTFTPPSTVRSASIVAGLNQIVVGDATGIAVGMEVSGVGIGTGATVTGIAGTTLTLSVPNTLNINGTVRVRPSQLLLKSWTLSNAGCNADSTNCSKLKDTTSAFDVDLSSNAQALHVVSCLATPAPTDSFSDLYFGITTANRSVNINNPVGSNVAFRRLEVRTLSAD